MEWFGLEDSIQIIWLQPCCHGQGHLAEVAGDAQMPQYSWSRMKGSHPCGNDPGCIASGSLPQYLHPWASAQCSGSSFKRAIEHIKQQFHLLEKGPVSPLRQSTSWKPFKNLFFQIPVRVFLLFIWELPLAKCFHLHQLTISLSYWRPHRILIREIYCFEQLCVVLWGGRNKSHILWRTRNVHNIQIHKKQLNGERI